MGLDQGGTDSILMINRLGRNADAMAVARNATRVRSAEVAGVPPPDNDPNEQATIRFGPQYDFDIGTNEAGAPELRFVYLVTERDAVTSEALSYVQVGYCDLDLAFCATPPEWTTAAYSDECRGRHCPRQFHPTIKYGESNWGAGFWKITYYELNATRDEVAIFAADVEKDSGTFSAVPLAPAGVTDPQRPCMDARPGSDYWGDYDDMLFNTARSTFVRPFTDSSKGCTTRTAYQAIHQHVSAVDLPVIEPESRRKVTFDYGVLVNDDETSVDIEDECKTWWFLEVCDFIDLDLLHAECLVDPGEPVWEEQVFDSGCVGGEVVGQLVIKCELQEDRRTVHVTVTARLREGDDCSPPVVDTGSINFDVGPGETTGDRPVEAENVDIFFTNGPPYDWIYVDFPGPQAIQNLQQ